MHVRAKSAGVSRPLRSRSAEAVLGLLLLAAVLAPRVGIEVHSHGGGEHAHVHFSPGSEHERLAPAHAAQAAHEAAVRRSLWTEVRHGVRHGSAAEPTGSSRLGASHDSEHVHAFDPFMHSVASEPLSLAIALALVWLAAPATVRATQPSLVTAQARAPPLSSRI